MKTIQSALPRAGKLLLILILVCGVLYTAFVWGMGQLLFPSQANGSIIEVDGVKYGSALLGQQYTDQSHMWGRMVKLNTTTFTNEKGEVLLYATPQNANTTSDEFDQQVSLQIEKIKAAHPEMGDTPIPEDLLTGSASGLDPHISPAAAQYQIKRLAKTNQLSEEQVQSIIDACTTKPWLGIFGQESVNVLKVNLMLDKILK